MIALEPRPAAARTRSRHPAPASGSSRAGLLALLAIALILVALTLRPFAGALFMGAVLATTLYPWYERLAARLGGRRMGAAVLLTAALVLALVLPLVALGVVATRETMDGLDSMRQILASEGAEGLIHRLPGPLQTVVEQVWRQIPTRERGPQVIFLLESRAATLIPRLAGTTGQIVLQAALTVIALFFFLLDGNRLVGWVNRVSPLHRTHSRELCVEFRRVSATVMLGSVATAGAQAMVAMVGYLIARVPNPYFLTFATFFVGLVPMLGAAVFSFAIAAYLYFAGHLYASVFLAIWSLGMVGLTDNVVKPLLIKGGIEMHGGIVFFTLIGGFAAFGPIGFVLGPMSVTFLIALLRIYRRDVAEPEAAA